ncbi:hypothetical protein ACHAWF_011219, partial [Thalassiosira exigua]
FHVGFSTKTAIGLASARLRRAPRLSSHLSSLSLLHLLLPPSGRPRPALQPHPSRALHAPAPVLSHPKKPEIHSDQGGRRYLTNSRATTTLSNSVIMYYAFIIGVNQDWPEQRCSHGDIGLARCLSLDCHLPKENISEIYDANASRSNILCALETLLDRRNENLATPVPRKNGEPEPDVLLIYYGGHGKPTEFCTETKGSNGREPRLQHIDLLERKFAGGIALCVIDCCHSGGFGEAVVQRYHDSKSLGVNYGCIMSVSSADGAGLEWTMTECLIRAWKGELLCPPCSHSQKKYYYLSTRKGKHLVKDINTESKSKSMRPDDIAENDGNALPSWRQVIEYLADEMARIKGDRLTTLFLGKALEDGQFLEKPCIFGNNVDVTEISVQLATDQQALIPRDETWMDPFRLKHVSVNDGVYVKWIGNFTFNEDQDIFPRSGRIGWFPGRVVSVVNSGAAELSTSDNTTNTSSENSEVCIELFDSICKVFWTITLSLSSLHSQERNVILGGLPFGFGFDPQCCVNIVTRMSKFLAYLDSSVPPNIEVEVMLNGKTCEAKTMCRTLIPWSDVDSEFTLDSAGPCTALRWEEDKSISFVPTNQCVVKNTQRDQKISRDELCIHTPMEAMMESLACEGKTLQGDSPLLCGSVPEPDADFWEAYDAEDCAWLKVQLMNKLEFSLIPLKVLAFHMCYTKSASFSVVYWECDSTLSLVPNSLLRPQSADSGGERESDSSQSSSEEGSSGGTPSSDHAEVVNYVEENSWKAYLDSG